MSYSVKLTNEIIISGFSAIQPNHLFSHRQLIATDVSNDSPNGVMNIGGSTQVMFDLTEYIGKKGLRFHDRSSKLAASAVKILLDETGLLEQYSNSDVCLVVGSDGALQAQNDVVREAVLSPRSVNPKAYPNRGCNVMAGQVSLMFNLLGESTVISAGYRSGVDALIYAIRKISVSDRPVPYLVAAGEGLSEARALRKKHKTLAGTDYILPIEGAVALLVEKSVEKSVEATSRTISHRDLIYQIIGYQQAHETTVNPMETIQAFIRSLGYTAQEIDQWIMGCEDVVQVQTQTETHVVPYDVFGATTLLQLLEAIGLKYHTQVGDPPNRIAIATSDRHGHVSMLLLQRKLN